MKNGTKKKKKLLKIIFLAILPLSAIALTGCSTHYKFKSQAYNWKGSISSLNGFQNLMNEQVNNNSATGFIVAISTSSCPFCRADRDVREQDLDKFIKDYSKNDKQDDHSWVQNFFDHYPSGNGPLNALANKLPIYNIYIPGLKIEDQKGFIPSANSMPSYSWLYYLKNNLMNYTYDSTKQNPYNFFVYGKSASSSTSYKNNCGWITNSPGQGQTTPSCLTMQNNQYFQNLEGTSPTAKHWYASNEDATSKEQWPTTWFNGYSKTDQASSNWYGHWPALLFIGRQDNSTSAKKDKTNPMQLKAFINGLYKTDQVENLQSSLKDWVPTTTSNVATNKTSQSDQPKQFIEDDLNKVENRN